MDIIQKIKDSNLCGRGGAGFQTGKKWEMVRDAEGEKKYVIANGSEGEPGVFKDSYILEKYPEKVVKGVMIAMQAIGAQEAYIYLREDLYKKHKKELKEIIAKIVVADSGQAGMTKEKKSPLLRGIQGVNNLKKGKPPQPPFQGGVKKIHIFREDGKYLNGEETTMLNSIEKKRSEPRYKPPYPTTCGLWECPTLVNNIETFYQVTQISEGKYKNKRFYSLSGKVENSGVFELDVDLTVDEVLKKTNNYPKEDFFVQTGGGAHGSVYTKDECKDAILQGAGALVVHDYQEDPIEILKFWTNFFLARNCGQCIPCREGFYRINQLLKEKEIDFELIKEILEVMADASYCALGQYAPEGYMDFIGKILKK